MRKTKKAAAKRFKVTATGKVKFKRTKMRHNTGKKAASAKLSKRAGGYVFEGDVKRNVAGCLPYGSLI